MTLLKRIGITVGIALSALMLVNSFSLKTALLIEMSNPDMKTEDSRQPVFHKGYC